MNSNLSKAEENIQKFDVLLAYSDIYTSMHLIDLVKDTVFDYFSNDRISRVVTDLHNASEQMKTIISMAVIPEYKDRMLAFTDLHTLRDRMKGKKIISKEFISNQTGWMRGTFMVINADEDGRPIKVLFTSLDINEEKEYEEELIHLSITDEMTRLGNRRAYELALDEFNGKELANDFVFVALDVNSLKSTNDNLGHIAGDELIDAAADHIRNAFAEYGNVYRTGGDEFVAIINIDKSNLDNVINKFKADVSSWHGKLVPELSISIGVASHEDYPELSLTELGKLADDNMYMDKASYYERTGKNRRRQSDVSADFEFRPLRRTKNAIPDDEAKALLLTEKRGTFAVIGDGEYPFAIPVDYYYDKDNEKIYFHGAKSGHKVDALKRNNKVCFTVYGNETYEENDWAPYLSSVVVYGRCNLIEDDELTHKHIKSLGMKYYPSEAEVDAEIARDIKTAQLYEISIEHICGKRIHEK